MTSKVLATTAVVALALAAGGISTSSFAATAADCPNGGTVRFGVEPFDTAPKAPPTVMAAAAAIPAMEK